MPLSVVRRPLSAIEQRQDVRVLQVGGGLDLAQEPLGADHRGELRPQHLDRDLAVVALASSRSMR